MGIWERNHLENQYKGGRRRMMDLSFGCVMLHCRILELTDLSCGSWDTHIGEEW
jgi:hypothetical protein